MQTEFNHAANDSPRSGSSKTLTPAAFAVILLGFIAVSLWLRVHG
jgi:hypothetical protein